MHEMAIAESVIEQITGRLGAAPVSLVMLEIGELSGVEPDAIRFCFEVVAAGSTVAGADLDIAVVAAQCRCRVCGERFRPADAILLCACGSADVEVTAGEELRIKSVGVRQHV